MIVGAGVTGALIAKQLTNARLRVLVLEAGPDDAGLVRWLHEASRAFLRRRAQGPRVPVAASANAPQPDTADIRSGEGYFVQNGPDPYGSSYTRLQGGSTLHWLGVACGCSRRTSSCGRATA